MKQIQITSGGGDFFLTHTVVLCFVQLCAVIPFSINDFFSSALFGFDCV